MDAGGSAGARRGRERGEILRDGEGAKALFRGPFQENHLVIETPGSTFTRQRSLFHPSTGFLPNGVELNIIQWAGTDAANSKGQVEGPKQDGA